MRIKRINYEKYIFEVFGILVIIILWELAAAYYADNFENGTFLFPSIGSVFKNSLLDLSAFYGMGGLGTGEYGLQASYFVSVKVIGFHTFKTLFRIIGGFALGTLFGVFSAIFYKANRYWNAFTGLPSKILSIIPQMALITLFLAWFGDSEVGYILFIAFGVFVAIYINAVNAIDNLPSIYYKYSTTLGAGRTRYFYNIVLPGIIPELSGCAKMIVGQAWALSMASEFISSQNGLGRIIVLARQRLDTGIILIVLVLYIVYTMITLKLLNKLCDYLTRWAPKM